MHFLSKLRRPSPAMMVAVVALFMAMSGGAYAAVRITTSQIADSAVTHAKLAKGAVGAVNLNKSLASEINRPSPSSGSQGAQGPKGNTGAQGPQGTKGDTGATGAAGAAGANGARGVNGLNPAAAIVNLPSIASSSGSNPNPDSGDAGDGGFYFTGNGSGGSAALAGGELVLTGVGVDGNTEQGGIGIAKAFTRPLSDLDGVSFDYHVLTPHGNNTPLVHVTVTGLTADSKFVSSGFANLVYSPALNGAGVSTGQEYAADAFLPGALWYSTTESNINNPGGQDSPQPLSFFTGRNANAAITQISLDNGGSSGASGDFAAGADDLVIGLGGSITRYDIGG